MANWYVYSGAAGSGTGADWTNAKTTLAAAATAAAAGDDIWVASDHAENDAASQTITTGTAASPSRIMSVSRAGSVPPVAADLLAGASITTTTSFGVTYAGTFYMFGVTMNVGGGNNSPTLMTCSASGNWQVFDTCAFNMVATFASCRITITNTTGSRTVFSNCTASFAATGQGFQTNGPWLWCNKPGSAAITGATLPTIPIVVGSSSLFDVILDGLDLSAFGSGKTIFVASSTRNCLINCKLGASVTVAATPTAGNALGTRVIGSHSSGNVRRDEIYTYQGTLTTETTIKRTAGASDGTTAFSWKIVTTANAKRTFPFETFEGAIWNDATGSAKTLTVHTVTDNVTLTDAEIWLEVEYLGSSGAPVSTLITDANATVLSTPANQTSDSGEAWTTTGLTTPLKQKLEVTFTPQMAGPIRWKVKVAKASTTVYVCPKADLS